MVDVRCKHCGKLFMKANIVVAAIKCDRCGKIFEYKVITNLHLNDAYDKNIAEPQEVKPITG